MNSQCRIIGHACEASLAYGGTRHIVNTPKVPIGRTPIKLDGRAEDRGIEPLWLLPAVQRFAGVPSTHTGSVLRSTARERQQSYASGMRSFVTISTICEILS